MTNSSSSNPPDDPESSAPETDLQDLLSEWQYARVRLANLKGKPELRQELVLVLSMLGIVFLGPAISWFHRWTISPSLQSYAILIIPAVAGWIWIARRRLAVPEVDYIRSALRIERQTRLNPKVIGERDKTVLEVLIHEPPVMDIRSSALLICALIFDAIAFWLRDPSLTCLGFILTCAGIMLYRHGKFAFRAALFPFLLMFAMVPIPGPAQDAVVDRAQPALLSTIEHIVNNAVRLVYSSKTVAAVPPEGDPLIITGSDERSSYLIYAERAGLCIPESIVVILCGVFYLSLIRTSNPLPKIGVVVSMIAACAVLIFARLIVICLAAAYDKEIAAFLEVLTRFLLFGADAGLLILFIRGFKCLKFHRWVLLSLKF